MKWIMVIAFVVIATACGGAATRARARTGADVVTAEWTSDDDAVLSESD